MIKTHLSRFIIVGVATQGTLLLFFWALVSLGVPGLVAVTAAYLVGLAASLVLNGKWTFGTLRKETAIGSTVRFAVLYAIAYGYSMLTFWALSLTGMFVLLDQILVMTTCAVLTFIGQKFWVFRNREFAK